MRLGEGATIRISVPLHVVKAEGSPGVKRGGAVNIVAHTIELECGVESIPQYIEADVGSLEIGHSLHLSDIKLPAGVKALTREDATLVTIVPPSGYAEEQKARGCGCSSGRCCGCSGGWRCGSGCGCCCSGCGCQGSRRRRQEEVISQSWRAVLDRAPSEGAPRHATLCWARQSRREIRT